MKESKGMMRRELSFMKKKGAPKSMIRHEEKEMRGMKRKKFAFGGPTSLTPPPPPDDGDGPTPPPPPPKTCPEGTEYREIPGIPGGGCAPIDHDRFKGRTPLPPIPPPVEQRMRGVRESMMGGRRMAGGGTAKSGGSYRRAADGIASKGKTKGHVVKMASGGIASSYRRAADGIATKGKTKGKTVKMMKGGYCG